MSGWVLLNLVVSIYKRSTRLCVDLTVVSAFGIKSCDVTLAGFHRKCAVYHSYKSPWCVKLVPAVITLIEITVKFQNILVSLKLSWCSELSGALKCASCFGHYPDGLINCPHCAVKLCSKPGIKCPLSSHLPPCFYRHKQVWPRG